MKKNRLLRVGRIAAAALVAGMVLGTAAGDAWAYFTTYTSASGGYAIELGSETRIEEEYSDHTKHVVVSNDGINPVYVRARAFSGSRYTLSYSSADGGWQAGGDGYYYYSDFLPGVTTAEDGSAIVAKTSELLVRIEFPEDAEAGEECNVVVIYESVPVQYDAEGNALAPQAADWTKELISGGAEGGNG